MQKGGKSHWPVYIYRFTVELVPLVCFQCVPCLLSVFGEVFALSVLAMECSVAVLVQDFFDQTTGFFQALVSFTLHNSLALCSYCLEKKNVLD